MTYIYDLKKSKRNMSNRYGRIIIVLAFFVGIFFHAQTNRYIYELRLKMDSTDNDYQKYFMILDIGKNETKFYGRDLLISDSINKKFGNMESKHVDMTGQIIKRKTSSFTNENFLNIKFDYYTYGTTDSVHWRYITRQKCSIIILFKKPQQTLADDIGLHGLTPTFL